MCGEIFSKMIYEPMEDSFLLENEIKKYSGGKSVLDIGAGSGILAEAALKSGAKSVLCTDINKEVIEHLKNKGFDAVRSDLFSNIKGKFDLIIFNPPYLPYDEREDLKSRLQTTGGKRGDEIIIRFLKKVRKYLNNKGIVLIVVSSLTPLKKIKSILKEKGLKKEVLSEKKFFMESLEVWKIVNNSENVRF